ncbi:hypothetical protein BGZ98_002355, partial [Dissophora globulifera]
KCATGAGTGSPAAIPNTDKGTLISNDIIFELSEGGPKSEKQNAKYRALIFVKGGKTFSIFCSRDHSEYASVDLGPVAENTYEGFDYVSVLDTSNKVLTLHIVGKKTWRGISIPVRESLIKENEAYRFKVAFRATSSTHPLPPHATYPVSTGVSYWRFLMPPELWIDKKQAGSKQPVLPNGAPSLPMSTQASASVSTSPSARASPSATASPSVTASPSAIASPLATATATATKPSPAVNGTSSIAVPPQTGYEHKTAPSPGLDTSVSESLAAFMESNPHQFQNIKLEPPLGVSFKGLNNSDDGYDVHFYHHDSYSGIYNVIGARRATLSAYSALSQFVELTEALAQEVADKIHLNLPRPFPSTSQQQQQRIRRPVMVDISNFPFSAFRALMYFVCSSDIESIMWNTSAWGLIRPLPMPTTPTATIASTLTSSTLYFGELLILAHIFGVHELFQMCVDLTKNKITVENVIQILVHFGAQSEVLKQSAMTFIKDNYNEIFAGDEPFKQLMRYEGGSQLMVDIMRMMATMKVSAKQAQ